MSKNENIKLNVKHRMCKLKSFLKYLKVKFVLMSLVTTNLDDFKLKTNK